MVRPARFAPSIDTFRRGRGSRVSSASRDEAIRHERMSRRRRVGSLLDGHFGDDGTTVRIEAISSERKKRRARGRGTP